MDGNMVNTPIQKVLEEMKLKIETLEKIVQEISENIVVLQNELYTKKNTNANISESDPVNVSNLKRMTTNDSFQTNSEPNKEETHEEQQLKCEHCEYKCKIKATMNKYMNTKHKKNK